jgi:hypothetical protein
LVSRAQESLARWKQDPRTPLDYAGFLLDLECLVNANADDADIHERWDDAFASIRGVLEKPADLFEACFPGAVSIPSFERKLAQALRLIQADYFRCHRDGRPHMSGFLKNGIGNCSARTKFLVSAFAPLLGPRLSPGQMLAIEVFSNHVETVIYDAAAGEISNLLDASITRNITASLYHPALLFHAFLKERGLPSPVTESDLLIRRGSQDKGLSTKMMLKVFEMGAQSYENWDETISFPPSSVHSGLASPPLAMQKLFNWFVHLPGTRHLKKFMLTPWGPPVTFGTLGGLFSLYYVGLLHCMYTPQTMEVCRSDPPHDASTTPEEHERNLRYLGFSHVHGAGFLLRIDTRLCFSDPEDASDMMWQMSYHGRREAILPHLTHFLGTEAFGDMAAFLDDPERALATLSEDELFTRMTDMREYERAMKGANDLSPFFAFEDFEGQDSSYFQKELLRDDQRSSAFETHLSDLRTWAELHPRDALAFVNAAPLKARRPLMDLLMRAWKDRELHVRLHAALSSDKASKLITHPPKHTPPVRLIEVDISELSSAELKATTGAEGDAFVSPPLPAPAQPSAEVPQDDAELFVAPATIAMFLSATSEESEKAFEQLARDGVWDASVTDVFRHMGQTDGKFYRMLGRYISFLETIPDHLKPLLAEGAAAGLIGHDDRGYYALDHLAREEVKGEGDESWVTRTLSIMGGAYGHGWVRR